MQIFSQAALGRSLALCVLGLSLALTTPVQAKEAFNPYLHKELPIANIPQGEEAKILAALGGKPQSISRDAAYRAHWREEIYPIISGDRQAKNEVILLLDFASSQSRSLWKSVHAAFKELAPKDAKLVLFGRSAELYATDLVGLGIWASYTRPKQAMNYLDWALRRWDEVKAAQKKKGEVKVFRSEYDAVASNKDYPLVFEAMMRHFKPAISEKEQSRLAKYAYDAGNVNLYQSTEVCAFYQIKKLPALVVNGKVVNETSKEALLQMLK